MFMRMKHWQDPVNVVLGLWLAISPWVLGHADEAASTSNAVIVGALVAVLALFEFFKVAAWEEWTNFALGLWLVVSPWLLGFSVTVAAMSNAVIVGIAVAVMALWALGTDKDIGGWWSHPRMQ